MLLKLDKIVKNKMVEEIKNNYVYKGIINEKIVEKLLREVLEDLGFDDEDAEQKETNECYRRKSVRRCRRRSKSR